MKWNLLIKFQTECVLNFESAILPDLVCKMANVIYAWYVLLTYWESSSLIIYTHFLSKGKPLVFSIILSSYRVTKNAIAFVYQWIFEVDSLSTNIALMKKKSMWWELWTALGSVSVVNRYVSLLSYPHGVSATFIWYLSLHISMGNPTPYTESHPPWLIQPNLHFFNLLLHGNFAILLLRLVAWCGRARW